MGRQPSVEQQEALRLFLDSDGEMPLVEIARRVGKKDGQIRKWKSTNKWDDILVERRAGKGNVPESNGNVTESSKGNVTETDPSEWSGAPPYEKRKRGAPEGNQNAKGHGAPKGNQNAVGNNGGAKESNQHAVTHGLYRQRIKDRLPPKIASLMDDLRGMPPLDVIYESILFDFAKIIEGMELLHVNDQEDHLTLIKKKKLDYVEAGSGDEKRIDEVVTEIEWEHHPAPILQANAMRAFATVQNSLRANIKLFMELSGEDDKRRLELQKMQQSIEIERERLDIERKKVELAEQRLDLDLYKALPKDDDGEETESDGFQEAGGNVSPTDVWGKVAEGKGDPS